MSFITAGLIIAGGTVLASGVNAYTSGRQAKKNRGLAREMQEAIDELEGSRQDVINPFDQMTSLSDQVRNPFKNLQVATRASEFQAEEADISLANALDQARAFGMAGGGATALARGALMSKRGISADIQKQEARNQLLAAQAEERANRDRIGEARRMQAMTAQGRAYEFETQENRDMARLDRLAGLQTNYQSAANQFTALSMQSAATAIPDAINAGLSFYNMATGPGK
tara:strand:+ start:1625 stop:2308 length:684 start_codon:yes stop_codon:yes gene_type:complete